MNDESIVLDAREVAPGEFHLIHGEQSVNVLVQGDAPELMVHFDEEQVPVHLLDERQAARMAAGGGGAARGADGTVAVQAPMPGKVVKALVAEGQEVSEGQGVMVVEAMKMENELRSPVDGTIKKVLVAEGKNVDAGEELVVIE